MTAATATAPLDVLRTRFQSDYYKQQLIETRIARGITDIKSLPFHRGAALHFRETFQILFAIPRTEGWRGLFKGLPAQLVGTVPARGIHFFVYGTTKRLYSETFNGGLEGPLVHIASAASAVAATAFATNPIWVVKTRLQLDHQGKTLTGEAAKTRQFKNAMDCARQVLQKEGLSGMYRGLSGSLLGISESATQWTLYEYGKKKLNARKDAIEDGLREKNWADSILGPFGDSVIAGGSKFMASLMTYPHEVRLNTY
jgi:solute carrier family 25 protein 33/36